MKKYILESVQNRERIFFIIFKVQRIILEEKIILEWCWSFSSELTENKNEEECILVKETMSIKFFKQKKLKIFHTVLLK